MVTVVDCFNFYNNLYSIEKVLETVTKGDETEEVEIPLSQLLIDQIEFANVIVLNKTDLVEEDKINQIEALIKKLNPDSIRLRSTMG